MKRRTEHFIRFYTMVKASLHFRNMGGKNIFICSFSLNEGKKAMFTKILKTYRPSRVI